MTEKQPTTWDNPVSMLEGDAIVASLPESAYTDPLTQRILLSVAISLRRLAEKLAPDSGQQSSEDPMVSQDPASSTRTQEQPSYPESYWAIGLRESITSFAAAPEVVPGAAERVLSALHASLAAEGYTFGHLGPSMEDKSVPGNVRLAPPIPTYALRAMLSLVP